MSVLFEHHFGGLDDGGDFVSHLQFHFIRAAPGDHAFYYIVTDTDHDMGHHAAQLDFRNFAFETISS